MTFTILNVSFIEEVGLNFSFVSPFGMSAHLERKIKSNKKQVLIRKFKALQN